MSAPGESTTSLARSPIWSGGIVAAVADRSFVYFGIGLRPARALAAFGANVVAAVHVTVADAPPEDANFPLLVVQANTHSRTDLQVPLFPDVLESRARDVRAFLAEHDPRDQATVVCGLPVPGVAIGDRAAWVTDAALGRALETKAAATGSLDEVLPWVVSEAVPAQVDERWWCEVTERLGSPILIVQAIGLNCGGERTWRCASLGDVAAAVEIVGESRVSAYVDGVSANVMAIVGTDGAVLVLPPSRQLTAENNGRPLYCGNVFAGISDAVEVEIVADAQRAGHALAARGYVGAFGLDCIVDSSGRRHYHEVNARVNGSVHALNLLFPAYAGLLLAPGWLGSEAVDSAQQEVADLVDTHPIARWVLIEGTTEPGRVDVPRSGVYRLDLDQRRASFLHGGYRPEDIGGDTVLLRPICTPEWCAAAGELVDVADLWCDSQLSNELEARWRGLAMARLLEMVRAASAN